MLKIIHPSPWNYKVLFDIFVEIELFTYSYSDNLLTLCEVFFKKIFGLLIEEKRSQTLTWFCKVLLVSISKPLRTQMDCVRPRIQCKSTDGNNSFGVWMNEVVLCVAERSEWIVHSVVVHCIQCAMDI